MAIHHKICSLLRDGIKEKDDLKKNLARFLKGQFDREHEAVSDEKAARIIRGFVKEYERDPTKTTITPQEIAIMRTLLPATLDRADTEAFLTKDRDVCQQIRKASREGMAMGIAMRACAQAHRLVDSIIVKEVVALIRDQPDEPEPAAPEIPQPMPRSMDELEAHDRYQGILKDMRGDW